LCCPSAAAAAQPDLEAFTFAGNVEVQLDVLAPTKTVVCHAHEARAHNASEQRLNSFL
jgi:hypothetical protein